MGVEPKARDLDELKALRVRVPEQLQVTLHAHRLLGDKTMSQMVQEALDLHFEEVFEENVELGG